ncbi:MAG: hypothetical protein AAGA50_13120 [Pseudomonadota bacterium]
MKLRFRALPKAISILVCAAGAAHACPMPDAGDYDEATGPDALIMLAEVMSIEFHSNEVANCSKAVYKVLEIFEGPHFTKVESQACFVREADEAKVDDLPFESLEELSENRYESGFYSGALVMVSLTRQKEPGRLLPPIQSQSEYRPAITSCWGFPHFNFGLLTEEESSEFLIELREAAAERKAQHAKEAKEGNSLLLGNRTAGGQ